MSSSALVELLFFLIFKKDRNRRSVSLYFLSMRTMGLPRESKFQYNKIAHPTKEETAMENSIVGVTRNEHGYQVTVKCDPSAIESMGGQSFTKMIFRSGENHQWFEFPSGERADPRMEVFLNKARAILDEESHSAR